MCESEAAAATYGGDLTEGPGSRRPGSWDRPRKESAGRPKGHHSWVERIAFVIEARSNEPRLRSD